MTQRELPERPNLEQLMKQAKSLLHAAQTGDHTALDRFRALPAFATQRVDPDDLALHDAQSVIAREHGFTSWATLREEVEARTLSFDAAIDEFIKAATGGATGRAERLLALYPQLAGATLHTALVLGDAPAVESMLRARPALATTPGGPQHWEPLLYVCHTFLHRDHSKGLLEIARQLLALGANPDAEYHWNWHPELPRTALWAALCPMRHLPLATLLLESGANPTDGVSAHIAGGRGDIEALELLHRFGMNVNGIPGGVPPLVYMMTFAENIAGPRWLLEHGADPDLPWGPDAESPLHVAARRWTVEMTELLVRHGADIERRRADGYTAHALAELHGNHDVAEWLLTQGAHNTLSALDQFIAAAARADRAAADALLRQYPQLTQQLRPEHHLMLHRPAESGNSAALETMLERGFDPGAKDKDGVTPLHRAAMGGHVEAVRTLLRFGAPKDSLDGMFAAPPIVWAVEGRNHAQPGTDHVAVARLLMDAGSPVNWTPPPGAPGPERTLEGLSDLKREASRPSPLSG